MKFSVDRIEGDIVVLENLDNKDIKEVSYKELPNNIQDGTVLIYENNEYKKTELEDEIRNRIKDKLERLKHLNN